MNKYRIGFGISLTYGLKFLFAASLLLIASCNGKKEEKQTNSDKNNQDATQVSTGLRILGRVPEFVLTDQTGADYYSDSLHGKVWVANFMFTRCVATCPKQTSELKKLQDELKIASKTDQVRLVSFSVDPTNDTSEVLAQYAEKNGADPSMWKFLTGDEQKIREEISLNGFKLDAGTDQKDPTVVVHSPMFVLVDASMRIRGMYDSGDDNSVNDILEDLKELEREVVNIPRDIQNPTWLASVRQKQMETADTIKVFHDFSFSDERLKSGIRFRNKIVDDAGRNYKAVHYDHGTGVVVTDIDGDDLLDIYFVNQIGANGMWRNLGDGRFEDITDSAGVGVSDRVCVSASFADIDNDGDPDLYVTAVRTGNQLFENLGNGKFKNITEGSGLGVKKHSSGAVFFDYDRDGLLDVFVANVGQYTTEETTPATMESIRGESAEDVYNFHVGFADGFSGHLKPERGETSRLFKNKGNNKFEDVTVQTGLIDKSWSGDATIIDANTDGWPDIYLLNMQGDDQFYVNVDGKKFEKKSRDYFPKTPWGSMGVKAFDFENDGDLDVFITDMHSDMSAEVGPEKEKLKSKMTWTPSFLATEGSSIFGNAFFRFNEEKGFEEISDKIRAENYWPWGLSVDDLNADGFDDAFLSSSMNFPFRYSLNSVLLNENGVTFRDSEFILGVEPRKSGTAAPWFELDIAGKDADASVLKAMKQSEPGLADLPDRAVVWSALGTRSSVIFDLDNDGDLDIVTNEMNQYPMVLISDLAEKNPNLAFVKIKLVGSKSNKSGLGAIVHVEAAESTLMKVKDGQSGYMSHSDMPLYFGLGNAQKIDRIRIVWPSGDEDVMEGPIEINQLLTIEESK